MCIYRIKFSSRYVCGKRLPLQCCENVCPFGPSKWRMLVSKDRGDTSRHYWVCRLSGEIEKVEDAESAIERVRRGEGAHVCRGLRYRFLSSYKNQKDGGFEEALRLTRFIDIHLEEERGKGCEVAIIDSGASEDTPSKAKISIYEASIIDGEGHGRYIHSIIHKLIPEANIHVIQVFEEEGAIPDYVVITALKNCIELRVHAVNLSIQSETWSDGCDPLSLYVNYLSQEKKIAVVVAAGNGGPRMMSVGSPGAARHAITVGATDTKGKLWKYSSRGPTLDGRFKPDLVAPGLFILNDVSLKGTSFAAPWVTATASIINRDLNSAIATRRILHLSSRPLPLDYQADRILLFKEKKPKNVRKLSMVFSEQLPLILDPRNLFGAGLLDVKSAIDMKNELFSEIKSIS
ncbi:MAG: S8 family serine peptidase [Nitrososphaerota archaeon]